MTQSAYRHDGPSPFTHGDFRYLLTLFSKSFSPFPQGTCILSVSPFYLAFDEVYHHLCAPISRNTTRKDVSYAPTKPLTGLSPAAELLSERLRGSRALGNRRYCHNSLDSLHELFLFHSPLLQISSLVSFPPLINMLKFSGYSPTFQLYKRRVCTILTTLC